MQISEVVGANDEHYPRTVGGLRGWPPATLPRNSLEKCLRVDPRPDLWTIMPPRRAYARNVNARNTNIAPPVPDQEVSNAKFWNAIQLLAQSVTNQNNHKVPVPTNVSGRSVAARVRDFVRMNPLEFLGSQVGEDPQNFIDEVKKIFGVMQVTRNDRVELASYQLKDVAHIWFMQWKENKGENAAPVEGDKLKEQAKDNKKSRTGNYEYSQQKSDGGNRSQFQQKSLAPAPSSASALSSRFQQDQKGRASGSKSQGSVSGNTTYPTCPKCGENHPAPAGRPTQHDTSSGTGGGQHQNRLYALQAHQDQEDSPDVVTAVNFGVSPETFSEPFSVSTLVSDPVITRRREGDRHNSPTSAESMPLWRGQTKPVGIFLFPVCCLIFPNRSLGKGKTSGELGPSSRQSGIDVVRAVVLQRDKECQSGMVGV
uniref:Gag-pol protein n=1 Tax=Solanum tuberosum TaxID=4113 RepID=M1DS27_SOLTU